MKLYIGNKKYSSWSLRPWIGMRVKDIEFEEVVVPFEMATGNAHFDEFSPTGKVPCLVDGDLTVQESMAILEYAADKLPERKLWPEDITARATARAISHEMHGGFQGLRRECPTNWARRRELLQVSERARNDVARIEQIWDECLQKFGGPFLFGEFCNADAMYAPVVNRLEIYCLSNADQVKRYTQAMQALPAWIEWDEAGKAEPWIVEEDEA